MRTEKSTSLFYFVVFSSSFQRLEVFFQHCIKRVPKRHPQNTFRKRFHALVHKLEIHHNLESMAGKWIRLIAQKSTLCTSTPDVWLSDVIFVMLQVLDVTSKEIYSSQLYPFWDDTRKTIKTNIWPDDHTSGKLDWRLDFFCKSFKISTNILVINNHFPKIFSFQH